MYRCCTFCTSWPTCSVLEAAINFFGMIAGVIFRKLEDSRVDIAWETNVPQYLFDSLRGNGEYTH